MGDPGATLSQQWFWHANRGRIGDRRGKSSYRVEVFWRSWESVKRQDGVGTIPQGQRRLVWLYDSWRAPDAISWPGGFGKLPWSSRWLSKSFGRRGRAWRGRMESAPLQKSVSASAAIRQLESAKSQSWPRELENLAGRWNSVSAIWSQRTKVQRHSTWHMDHEKVPDTVATRKASSDQSRRSG